jgi:pyrroloquinoline quinone biosynthesis protein B
VSGNGRNWYLLNASPDIRQQIEQTPCLHPQGDLPRHSPIVGVILTNADVDHVAGLLSLRERHPLTLYGTERVLSVLDANAIFNVLDRSLVMRRPLPLDVEVRLGAEDADDSLSIVAFAVPGKVALWLEETAASGLAGSAQDTVGLKVSARSTGAHFFYVPGCASLPADLSDRLRNAPLVFFDGTTWADDELRQAGVGSKTAERMGHLSMSGPRGSIAGLSPLGIARKIFIHINNTNPVLLTDSSQRWEAEAQGWEIAEDGMEIRL